MSSLPRVRLLSLVLVGLFAVAWCVGFFGEVLPGDRTFAFRDTGHYYYRLFAWVNEEIKGGQVPLWNPHENSGVPQVADASSSVFYPGKLLLLIPGADYTTLFNAYIVFHYLWAAMGIAMLARRWQFPPLATSISVISFVSCGVLISQTCNVVFLVGAAWLPWACLALSLLRQKPWVGAAWLATVLAMMVLGGDPQMAYHVILIGLLMIACDRRGHQPIRTRQTFETFESYRSPYRARGWSRTIGEQLKSRIDGRLIYLGGAALFAIGLSAIQVLPTVVWSRDSSRAMYERPRSIYETFAFVGADQTQSSNESAPWYEASQGLVGEPVMGTHHDHLYQFSVAPWTLPEVMWPNFGGRMYPVHRRWIDEVGSYERVWNPSIYLGCFTCLLAFSAWSLRGKSSRQRILSWMLVLSLLASLGWYGLGWLLREVLWITSGTPPQAIQMGSPTGGIYWLLVTLLPGYAQFRYPAKWLVICAFAVSLLAGLAINRIEEGRIQLTTRRIRWLVGGFGLITGLTLVISWIGQSWLGEMFFDRPADRLFGPFDVAGAWSDARLALLQSFLTLLIGGVLLWQWHKAKQPISRISWGALLIVVIGGDYLLANRWVMATASTDAWENYSPQVLAELSPPSDQPPSDQPPSDQQSVSKNIRNVSLTRVYRTGIYDWLPPSFETESSSNRMEEIVRWDTATLFPKHQLPLPISLVESYGSITAADQEMMLQVGREHIDDEEEGSPELAIEVLEILGTERIIAPTQDYSQLDRCANWQRLTGIEQAWMGSVKNPLPRAWLVKEVTSIRAPQRRCFSELHRVSVESLRTEDGEHWRELDEQAVVYSRDAKRMSDLESADQQAACHVVGYSSQHMEVEVATTGRMLLVVNEYYRPGWQAKITSLNSDEEPLITPVIRVNQVMRGIVVPEGEHRVELFYDPVEFRWGCWISLASWSCLSLGLIAGLIWMRVQAMRDEHRRLTGRKRKRVRSDS